MRLAVLADIHGNILALEAVLAHNSPCRAGLRPRRRSRRLRLRPALAAGDVWPASPPLGAANGARQPRPARRGGADPAGHGSVRPLRRRSANRRGTGASRRPSPDPSHVAPGILACHARADRARRTLPPRRHPGRPPSCEAAPDARSPERARRRRRERSCSAATATGLTSCAFRAALTVLNPGSVGCPAYEDPVGRAHVFGNRLPARPLCHPRYLSEDEPRRQLVPLPYAWEDAARRAKRNARPDWAHALRTGFMPR